MGNFNYPITRLLNYPIRDRIGNRDANLDSDRIGAWRRDAETNTRAVGDPGRERDAHAVCLEPRAGAVTVLAWLAPGVAASAAMPAQAANRHPIGTTSPSHASRRDTRTSRRTTTSRSSPARSPRKASRMRSTARSTLGKSMAISSAKQSCGIEVT